MRLQSARVTAPHAVVTEPVSYPHLPTGLLRCSRLGRRCRKHQRARHGWLCGVRCAWVHCQRHLNWRHHNEDAGPCGRLSFSRIRRYVPVCTCVRTCVRACVHVYVSMCTCVCGARRVKTTSTLAARWLVLLGRKCTPVYRWPADHAAAW